MGSFLWRITSFLFCGIFRIRETIKFLELLKDLVREAYLLPSFTCLLVLVSRNFCIFLFEPFFIYLVSGWVAPFIGLSFYTSFCIPSFIFVMAWFQSKANAVTTKKYLRRNLNKMKQFSRPNMFHFRAM